MATNRQSERSKEWLVGALLQLMEEKPYHAITVTDLTNRAGVSRLTFYRNFETKEDILFKRFEDLFASYRQELDALPCRNLKEALNMAFVYWSKNKKYIKLLLDNNLESVLYSSFSKYLPILANILQLSSSFTDIQQQFVSGGLIFTLIDWIKKDGGESPEELTTQILGLIDNCYETLNIG